MFSGIQCYFRSHELWRKRLFLQLCHTDFVLFALFRNYINNIGLPAKGVPIKIRKLFREIEISNEPLRTSNYAKYLSLQGCEPGMQYDAHECASCSYLQKCFLILIITAYLRHFVMIVVTLQWWYWLVFAFTRFE